MINSLKGIESINGKGVVHMDELRSKYPEKFNESGQMDYKWFETEIRPNKSIFIRHDVDSLTFSMLTKPASKGGNLKRCQLTDLISTSLIMLKYLNAKFPCRENSMTITKLEEALMWQQKRTEDRINRNVEGKDEL